MTVPPTKVSGKTNARLIAEQFIQPLPGAFEQCPGTELRRTLGRAYLDLEAERDALRKSHRAFLQHLIDAEKFDARFGLTLPGDSALAALINSATETLERSE